METYSVEILNPKAIRLLEDLADLQLIAIELRTVNNLTDEDAVQARNAVLRGSPNMDLDAMLEHLQESRQDRKLPFRDE
ncbi:hypothetical protein [Spirosoma montaniterrae]|uniref:Uncharacterized protein n=1 Tax=Spirosoma montaniterrae TaxID=1178516 RepID=A0A1P9X086_9BACT|nr:hypothetical protein [Spirosoma montaniterrae]AQG80995.1 hypothetical protein AWR27_17710 [Spirosoma montaniterrae]